MQECNQYNMSIYIEANYWLFSTDDLQYEAV